MLSAREREVTRRQTEASESGGSKHVLSCCCSDAGLDILVRTAGRAVDLDPPSGTAVIAAPLSEVALPGEPQDGVVMVLGELDRHHSAQVSLPVGAEVGEEVVAIVWHVDELWWRDDCNLSSGLVT